MWLQGQHAWAVRHRRGQLLGAMDVALRSLFGLEEALAAWQGHSASAEAALVNAANGQGVRVVLGLQNKPWHGATHINGYYT